MRSEGTNKADNCILFLHPQQTPEFELEPEQQTGSIGLNAWIKKTQNARRNSDITKSLSFPTSDIQDREDRQECRREYVPNREFVKDREFHLSLPGLWYTAWGNTKRCDQAGTEVVGWEKVWDLHIRLQVSMSTGVDSSRRKRVPVLLDGGKGGRPRWNLSALVSRPGSARTARKDQKRNAIKRADFMILRIRERLGLGGGIAVGRRGIYTKLFGVPTGRLDGAR